jgi:cytochrome c-type biogenesis protein
VLADFVRDGLGAWWAPALAFAAGVVSFASPCVFPLVPGYLSFVAGGEAQEERRPVVPILLFIAGFGAVFTLLGAFSGAVSRFLISPTGERVAGVVIVAFGVLLLLYALRLGSPGLFAERRPLLTRVRPGPVWAFPLGVAFGTGWLVYSAGLGLPFLLVGMGIRKLMGALDFVKRNYHWIAGVSGVVMVAIGVLIVTNLWNEVLAPVRRAIEQFSPPI